MANAQHRAKLRELIDYGHLPSSQCGARFRAWIGPLLDTASVVEVRSGGGRQLKVVNQIAAERFFGAAFPLDEHGDHHSSRVRSLATFRSTKRLLNNTPPIVTLRVASREHLILPDENSSGFEMTRSHGVFAMVLEKDHQPRMQGKWVLIENPALFLEHYRVFGSGTSALLTNGRLSNRVLNWLAANAGTLELTHAPDYDPLGLHEYIRLYAKLGGKLQLHLPPNLDQLFASFSDKQLLLKPRQQRLLRSLQASENPGIQRVCALMCTHNAGLEQEVLLLDW